MPTQGESQSAPTAAGQGRGFDDSAEDGQRQRQGSLLGRMNQRFQDVLQTSRGGGREPSALTEVREEIPPTPVAVNVDDLAGRRARTVRPQRMVVPEGVLIEGNLTSGSDTEIAGRIEGNVAVESATLVLESSAQISGTVRAGNCRVEGFVDGRVECAQDLEIGQNARINAGVSAARRLSVAGQIMGDITSGGLVRLAATAKVSGDIRARNIVIEEGAVFNGSCIMRPSGQGAETRQRDPEREDASAE